MLKQINRLFAGIKLHSMYTEQILTNWKYRKYDSQDNEEGEEWKDSRKDVSCTEIHADLLANNEIKDPFLDMNEKEVQWIGETDWEYKNEFIAPKKELKENELVFEGLDTFATVYLNDKEILKTDNMFREYQVNVSDQLLFGQLNTLRIVFKSALLTAKEIEKKRGTLACFNGDPCRLYARKAQYHFGWDWGPVLITCGPYKPVKLVSYNTRVEDVYVKIDTTDLTKPKVSVEATIKTSLSSTVNVEVVDPQGNVIQTFSNPIKKSGLVSYEFEIENPELWYPIGHGKQPLYDVNVSIPSGPTITKHVGIRKVELIQEEFAEQSGTSFYFKVNDIPIYATGSNWIPAHSLQTMLTDQDYKDWLRLTINGHQNMIRVWAGGYYEQDIFYEECDRLGIMVWQDFMFACGQYPGDPEFIANVSEEVKHQLKRLRNHCSITIYAGNNEDYQVAEQCGLEWDPNDTSGDYSNTTFPARTIYETTLPKLVSQYQPDVPYHPGSPWGGNGTADPTIGDLHQWNVWHGSQEKYQNWYKLGGRFVSEFGMEALPNRKTYEQCISDPTELYPQSETVDHHNKADGFERRLALYVIENIKVQGLDFDSWIYATQLMQAECLGYAYRCWRREWRGEGKRYNGGTIVWQINDCWPVASWSIIDFYKRPKLAYYSVKRESQPIGVGMYRTERRDGVVVEDEAFGVAFDYRPTTLSIDLWGVNSKTEDQPAILKVDIYHVTSGEKLKSLPDTDVVLKANLTTEFIKDLEIANDKPVVVYGRFVSKEDGKVLAWAGDWPQPLKYLKFPDRKVDVEVHDGHITLTSDKPVKGVEIIVDGKDTFLQDNGFDLFPGDTYTVVAEDVKESDKVTIRYYH